MVKEFPERGETVVCKVIRVLNYGVFAELLEYDNQKGFVHISQVATTWVKNIRNHVKENQVRAAKVLYIDREKDQIDLSLTKVGAREQRKKIDEYKQLKRSQKLIEILAKEQKKPFEIAWTEIADPLIDSYGNLYSGLQKVALEGESALDGLKKEWVKPLVELVKKNISPPKKTVRAVLDLSSSAPDGVEVIKNALLEGGKIAGKESEIFYSGSGNYVLKVTAHDYKIAEKNLNDASEKVLELIKASGGEASVKREKEN